MIQAEKMTLLRFNDIGKTLRLGHKIALIPI